jgi:phosphohistidine phosphatase
MPAELLLLRHGKAAGTMGGKDFERPLKDSGKRKVQRIGVWLDEQALRPDYVMTSAAMRARVTAEKCLKAMTRGTDDLVVLPDLYLATSDRLITLLRTVPDGARRVLVVGHNPGLSELVSRLDPSHQVSLKPASLAHLRIDIPWHQIDDGCGTLRGLLHASELPQDFPFPGPHGTERRPRPAYYYTQSAVIPYRRTPSGLQVLVVQSSKKSHWVLPKGIADPGLSLTASAEKEALEEAGIEGQVHDTALGDYEVEKWGARCQVKAYPMAVVRELTIDEWEESHRGRRWVTPSHAAILLQQPALAELVQRLEAWLDEHESP